MKLPTARRSAIAQDLISDIEAGSANPNALLEIYSGSMPGSMGQIVTDTLLAELELDNPPATETDGLITFNTISTDPSGNDNGEAGWARILDRDRVEAQYLTVTAIGGGGDIELNSTSIVAGTPVSITSGKITVGGV